MTLILKSIQKEEAVEKVNKRGDGDAAGIEVYVHSKYTKKNQLNQEETIDKGQIKKE